MAVQHMTCEELFNTITMKYDRIVTNFNFIIDECKTLAIKKDIPKSILDKINEIESLEKDIKKDIVVDVKGLEQLEIDKLKKQASKDKKRLKMMLIDKKQELSNLTNDINVLVRLHKSSLETINKMNEYNVTVPKIDYKKDSEKYFLALQESYQKELNNLELEKQNKKKMVYDKFNLDSADYDKRINDKKIDIKNNLSDLDKKINKLNDYKPMVSKVMEMNSIDYSIANMNVDDLDIETLERMVDSALYICDISSPNKSFIKKVFQIFYLPIEKEWSDTGKIIYCIVLLIIMLVFSKYILSFACVLYLAAVLVSIQNMNEKREMFARTFILMTDVNLNYYIDNNEDVIALQKEKEEFQNKGVTEEYNKIDNEIQIRIDELTMKDIEGEKKEFYNYVDQHEGQMKKNYRIKVRKVSMQIEDTKENYGTYYESLDDILLKVSKYLYTLGDGNKKVLTYDKSVVLGNYIYNNKRLYDYKEDLPLEAIIFTYATQQERQRHIDFIKLLLCNALLNVRTPHLFIHVFDSLTLGREMSEFLIKDLSTQIILYTKGLNKLIENISIECTNRGIKYSTNNIDNFNINNEKRGMVTDSYNIVILLNDTSNFLYNIELNSLMRQASNLGYAFWVLNKKQEFKTSETDKIEEYCKLKSGLAESTEYGVIKLSNGKEFGRLPNGVKGINYTLDLGNKCLNTYSYWLREDAGDFILWTRDWWLKGNPQEQFGLYHDKPPIWWASTRKGIELHFGYLDGDPSKPLTITLGDNNVHGLMAGATGAGKSATINFILANMFLMYPPSELIMIMIDFKNVEFSFYAKNKVPQPKLIAGTKDGEYALSIFKYAYAEMRRREKLLTFWGVKKVEEFNDNVDKLLIPTKKNLKKFLNKWQSSPESVPYKLYQSAIKKTKDDNVQYIEDNIIPRLFILIDEFQVMFNELPPKIIDEIKAMITGLSKLARAMGAHMFFTSQSMTGTMSKDTLDQFSLRAALRCSADVSDQLLGNKAASLLRGKGFVYTNCTAGADPSANQLWRIPYIDTPELADITKIVREACGSEDFPDEINRDAKFYDEDEAMTEQDLLKELKSSWIKDINDKQVHYILGSHSSFVDSQKPANSTFFRQDGEHMVISSINDTDYYSLIMTMIRNIQNTSDSTLIINSEDMDANSLIQLEEECSKGFEKIVHPGYDQSKLFDFVNKLMEKRKETKSSENKPIFILSIGWDKVPGLCREGSYKTQEKFTQILKDCGKYNIHFIIAIRSMKEAKFLNSVCKHFIIGQSDNNTSLSILDSEKACKMSEKFAIYKQENIELKFKVYQFKFKGKIAQRSIA